MADWLFQPKQLQFLDLIEKEGEDAATKLGFGGARGGTKSRTARDVMLARRLKYPRTTGYLIRRNFPDLRDNHILKFHDEHPEFNEFYSVSNKEYLFPESLGGSRIAFRYADTESDVRQMARGPEAMDIFVDQAEQFNENELLWMKTPNRWPGSTKNQCKYAMFFNPGGPGTEYLRRVFWRREYRPGESPGDYAFIQAYGWDNYEWFRNEINIDPVAFYRLPDADRFRMFIENTSYGRELNSLPESLRIGELLGSFEQFAGQYFADVWDEKRCVLTTDQVNSIVQPWWTRWMAQDWGFGDHTCHLWFVSGKMSPSEWMKHFGGECNFPVDICIVYREYVARQTAEMDLAVGIADRTPLDERKQIQRFFLSEDAFGQRAKQSGGPTIGDQYNRVMSKCGLPQPEPATQDRVMGWRFMHGCLRQSRLRGAIFDRQRAEQGPAVFISAECPNIISSIPLAVRDEKNHEDVMRVDGALWEDCTDAARYGLLSQLDPRGKAPLEVRAKEEYHSIQGDMTAKSIKMLEFKLRERQSHRLSRVQRWR